MAFFHHTLSCDNSIRMSSFCLPISIFRMKNLEGARATPQTGFPYFTNTAIIASNSWLISSLFFVMSSAVCQVYQHKAFQQLKQMASSFHLTVGIYYLRITWKSADLVRLSIKWKISTISNRGYATVTTLQQLLHCHLERPNGWFSMRLMY